MARVARMAGIATVVVAAFALVTLVPLRSLPTQSTPIAVHATTTNPAAPACATMGLSANLESRSRVPLVNVFGVSSMTVALVSPLVAVSEGESCPDGYAIPQATVVVSTPRCANPSVIDDPEPDDGAFTSPTQSRCHGNGVAFQLQYDEPPTSEAAADFGSQTFPLGSSGLMASDEWCLRAQFGVAVQQKSLGAVSVDGTDLDVVDGSMCAPVG